MLITWVLLIYLPIQRFSKKKGYVLPFKEKEIKTLTKGLLSKKEYEIVTTIPVYQGESGSPIFLETDEDEYYLAGITTKTFKYRRDNIDSS